MICIPPLVLAPLPVLTLSLARPGGVNGVVLVSCSAAALVSLYCTLILDPGFIRTRRRDAEKLLLDERYVDNEETDDDGDDDALVAAMRRGTSC